MNRKPWDDNHDTAPVAAPAGWQRVLSHRTAAADQRDAAARFEEAGLGPDDVAAVLDDGGDALFAAAAGNRTDWAVPFGGLKAVALLAAELSTLAAALNSRASGIRSVAVGLLLEDYSAVSVARELGISRQKVYEVGRAGFKPPYIETVPWKRS